MKTYSVSCHLILLLALIANQSAFAISPLKADVKLSVAFPARSFKVPKTSITEISNQTSCLKSISLEVVIITTTGDNAPTNLNGVGQMKLAANRANALRASFMALGIPDYRIYTEAKAEVQKQYPSQPPMPNGGTAQIMYTGNCTSLDCQVQCREDSQ